MRVVQDHGTVEIMRGCPNACRFCHAASFYRPCRRKNPEAIRGEVVDLVRRAGYREITLSSLSSGDYPDVHDLVRGLNAEWSGEKVSFSLPSLRVDSLSLGLLAGLAEVRKSGLTFAVETPRPEWQTDVRKQVPLEKVVAILREAKARGWKAAKFYFMVGLPPAAGADEAGPIVEFLREVRASTGMTLNVNVAGFIPKPHTPYERAAQIGEQDALDAIQRIRAALRGPGFKIGYHAPFLSLLEGIVSRGDERAGELVLEAYRRGARLDAWEEHLQADLWRAVIADAGWDVIAQTCRARAADEQLPWDAIGLALSRSEIHDLEPITAHGEPSRAGSTASAAPAPVEPARVLFRFTKRGRAVWISHLDLMTVFERSLARVGIPGAIHGRIQPQATAGVRQSAGARRLQRVRDREHRSRGFRRAAYLRRTHERGVAPGHLGGGGGPDAAGGEGSPSALARRGILGQRVPGGRGTHRPAAERRSGDQVTDRRCHRVVGRRAAPHSRRRTRRRARHLLRSVPLFLAQLIPHRIHRLETGLGGRDAPLGQSSLDFPEPALELRVRSVEREGRIDRK